MFELTGRYCAHITLSTANIFQQQFAKRRTKICPYHFWLTILKRISGAKNASEITMSDDKHREKIYINTLLAFHFAVPYVPSCWKVFLQWNRYNFTSFRRAFYVCLPSARVSMATPSKPTLIAKSVRRSLNEYFAWSVIDELIKWEHKRRGVPVPSPPFS